MWIYSIVYSHFFSAFCFVFYNCRRRQRFYAQYATDTQLSPILLQLIHFILHTLKRKKKELNVHIELVLIQSKTRNKRFIGWIVRRGCTAMRIGVALEHTRWRLISWLIWKIGLHTCVWLTWRSHRYHLYTEI